VTLDRAAVERAAKRLANRDRTLASILRAHGSPPLWSRRPGFGTLVRIILEQQVSLASARATFERLRATVPRLTPRNFLQLDDARLRRLGFSRQKVRYCRELARSALCGRPDLRRLGELPDDPARRALLEVKGIGPWTADIYLLMALRRPDVWPAGDLALAKAVQRLRGLAACPTQPELLELAEGWRPYRAVAARMLWQYYLAGFEV
jgi:DNA-3-methyladenine glycosylase II